MTGTFWLMCWGIAAFLFLWVCYERSLLFQGLLTAVALGAVALGCCLLRQLVRLTTYYRSFKWPSREQRVLDARLADESDPLVLEQQEFETAVDGCIAAISGVYQVARLPDDQLKRMDDFIELFRDRSRNLSLHVLEAYRLTDGRFTCEYCVVRHEGNLRHLVHVSLPFEMGRVMIRPKAPSEKITDIFTSRGLSLEIHREFLSRYYIIAQDEDLVRSVPHQFFDILSRRASLAVQVDGHDLLISKDEPLRPDTARELMTLAFELASIQG